MTQRASKKTQQGPQSPPATREARGKSAPDATSLVSRAAVRAPIGSTRTAPGAAPQASPPPSATYQARNLLKTSPKRPAPAKALSPESPTPAPATPVASPRTKVRPTMSQKSTNTQSHGAQARRE